MGKRIFTLGLLTVSLLLATGQSSAKNPLDRYFGATIKGKILVASPTISDKRFRQSVILMVDHDADGAFGLIINKPLYSIKKSTLFDKLNLKHEPDENFITIFYGGPVDPKLGFVIHEAEYSIDATRRVTDEISVSPERDVILAMAKGEGPKRYVFALGYSGWLSGQLEFEMRRGDWLIAPANSKIVFDDSHHTKWQRASNIQYQTL